MQFFVVFLILKESKATKMSNIEWFIFFENIYKRNIFFVFDCDCDFNRMILLQSKNENRGNKQREEKVGEQKHQPVTNLIQILN